MKKQLITSILLLDNFVLGDNSARRDTTIGTFIHDKVIQMQGNTSQKTTGCSEIRIKKDIVWQLTNLLRTVIS